MSSFKVRTSEYNVSNLQDLGASLSQFIIKPISQTSVVNISSSQLLNIATSPILLVPSPGTGLYNVVVSYTSVMNYQGTPYSFAGSLGIFYGNITGTGAGVNFDHTFATATNSSVSIQMGTGITDININSLLNEGLYLVGSSYTGGNSPVKITVVYNTFSFP